MKVDLASQGAPELPEGFYYQIDVYNVFDSTASVRIAIVHKTKERFLGLIDIPRRRVIGVTTVTVPDNPNTETFNKLVGAASRLYWEHKDFINNEA